MWSRKTYEAKRDVPMIEGEFYFDKDTTGYEMHLHVNSATKSEDRSRLVTRSKQGLHWKAVPRLSHCRRRRTALCRLYQTRVRRFLFNSLRAVLHHETP